MSSKTDSPPDPPRPERPSGQSLRQRATAKLQAKHTEETPAQTPVGTDFLHELRVHQIELEMQNEELRAAQLQLETSRARYFDLYDLAPVGYLTLRENGSVLEANLTATTLLHTTVDALVNHPLTDFIQAEDQDVFYRFRRQLFGTGQPQACELRLRRADGAGLWTRLDALVSPAEGSGARACRITMTDFTERKRAEEEKEKLQARLTQAQKMESVGRLAGGVAHEFNNSLTVIMGHIALALTDLPPDSPLRASLEAAQRSAQHSADLTRQLLAFARKQTIAPTLLNLNDAVAGTLKMLRQLMGEGVDLVWQPGSDLGLVNMDRSQVDQILADLCVNARDAIGGKAGQVTIAAANAAIDQAFVADHPDAQAGEYVRLTVSDDGCGMSAEVLAKVFEPFFATKEFGHGAGLGLATVYGLVRQNDGFITVTSTPGAGTTCHIHLPRHAGRTAVPAEEASAPAPGRRHATILLVEDEPFILGVSRRALERLGYTVLSASDPRQAIRLSREHTGEIDLLVTDVVMPEMDGRDLALRLLSLRPNLRLLYMSGYPNSVIAHDGVLDRGVHFLQKPFGAQALVDMVREALDE